ncbi:uncharacterized protein LOC115070620 [Nannospalax galili]|uniref:uncharacterized protein LOC115070620 n=1 Tax=Nannospalax galili TaxID=1026970 RepID=UPI00111C60D3|nr:uncharacterized protein LOC115070620 [Nannospalax galili]
MWEASCDYLVPKSSTFCLPAHLQGTVPRDAGVAGGGGEGRDYKPQEVVHQREALPLGSDRTTSPRRQCTKARPAGDCGSPRSRAGRGAGPTPTCQGRARSGQASRVAWRWGRGEGGGGLRAARAPQSWRAAPRPPLGPHCFRGKLRGDVPLLQALPAHAGCHRHIASPRCSSRLPDRPAADRYRSPAREPNSDLRLPRPDNNKRPQGPAPLP